MARAIQVQPLVLLLLLTATAWSQATASNILVSYSFDDDQLATGPDTFSVFERAKGHVRLTVAARVSGYRSVEIRDTAGDGDFPELQGYFERRDRGKLFLHFAFLTPDPSQELNIALAGPSGFTLRKDGIGFWLKTGSGYLYQYSDSMPKKLLLLRPFIWYTVDAAYDITAGVYDLDIYEENLEQPVVSLEGQANAASQPGSTVDKFSFIGDRGQDTSNVTYFVDDVVVSIDERRLQRPLVAPGRRKLFIDSWNEVQRLYRSQPGPLPALDWVDFGILPPDTPTLTSNDLWPLLQALARGRWTAAAIPVTVSGRDRRLVEALVFWRRGCELLVSGEAALALADFQAAGALVPEARIYAMNEVLALVALKCWKDVDLRLASFYAEWETDLRFPVLLAIVGVARDNLGQAQAWLESAADPVPDDLGQKLMERLRSGSLDQALIQELRQHFPRNWRDYIRERLVAEQYFFVLLWNDAAGRAAQYAERMVARLQTLGIPAFKWLERRGDAAFYQGNYRAALDWYQTSLKQAEGSGPILVKLADTYFKLGDLENERICREQVYGSLTAD